MSGGELPVELFDGDTLITDVAELLTYEIDGGFDRAAPEAVLLPRHSDEIRRLVEWAAERRVPVVARGAGTGLSGGALASSGGIVVSTERLLGLEIDPARRTARAQAGVTNQRLDSEARRHGLFYPPDPASGRTSVIGGNVATNAGGPHCFKYGVTGNYVRAIEALLADGTSIELGGVVDPPGYDLSTLLVGSEGTLALVTAVTVDLRRQPPAVRTMMVSFATLASAGEAVSAVIAAGLEPAAIEAIDRRGMEVIEAYRSVGLPVDAGAALIVEVDGYRESLERQVKEVSELLVAHGGSDLRVARSDREREEIWFARKSAAGALARLAPSYYLTDISVRRSRLAEVLERVLEICDRHGLETASFFHAGDGNLHPLIPCDQRDEELMARVHRAVEEIIDLCLAEGGSITGEHGIGMEKRRFMSRMYGPAELSAMRDVKRAFDPQGLLNPGKVLPEATGEVERAAPRPLPETGIFTPASAAEAASGLAEATARTRRVVIVGGEAEVSDDGVLRLSTRKLAGIRELAARDLFVSVGAGTTVEQLERSVSAAELHCRLSAPWSATTVGGLLARNLDPPSRMLYGGLRDAVLAATVVLADGRTLYLGRPLVKNVAGYDLQRLFVGSAGTLGLLTEVTLKLEPKPERRRTLELEVDDFHLARRAAERGSEIALVASGIVVEQRGASEPGLRVCYTAEGLSEDVDAELAAVTAAWEGLGGTLRPSASSASERWSALIGGVGVLVARLGVPPAALPAAVREIRSAAPRELLVDWPAGLIWCALHRAADLAGLRRAVAARGGYAVVVTAPEGTDAEAGGAGERPHPAAIEIMRRLERSWDPAGILTGDGVR